jgi:PAS domain S-box-containing protein
VHSAAQLDALWNAPVGLALFDADLRYVRVNAALAEMNGVPAEEHVGRTVRQVLPDQDPDVTEQLRRVRDEGVSLDLEVTGVTRREPAEHRTWRVSYFPVREGGLVIGVGATVIDVTRRKRTERALRESEARLRRLADAMPQLVWTALPDGTVDYYNRRRAELAGIEERPDGTWSWAPVIHPDDLEATMAAWQRAVSTGEPYVIEHRVQRADGTFRWYLSRGEPERDAEGRVVRWYGTATDIDDQKEAQRRLEEADRRKDEFLGMLSHELRNPLAPIRNALWILDRSEPGTPPARRAREIAGRQVEHLTRLVDDLLDVTRIARGKVSLRREPLDLAALVRRVVEDHRALLRERGLALGVDAPSAPVPVHGDATRLAQVLGNLLGNAAKFTPSGGRVDVSLSRAGAARAAGVEEAVLRVGDTGAGIEPGLLGSIFEPFTQAKQTLARSEGGLGLGLALVKGLVALHGGRVHAESAGAGRGTEIVIALPLAPGAATAPGERRASGPAAKAPPRHVLVVDDNRDAAETLAQLVELLGHAPDVALDGQAALRAVERGPCVDVVLCDLGLPGMDGYEVARTLRARHGDAIRLFAVSGYAQPEDVARARQAGFDGHIAKPPDPGAIARALVDSRPPCSDTASRSSPPPSSGPAPAPPSS